MPDYDVSAVALASPPTSAPVTDYRPGIAVQNLGIHDANVTGYLDVYDRATGLKVAHFDLAADDIEPGETRTASASTLWTPTEADVGKHFLFTGFVSYPPDQNLANNQLQPVDVLVTAEEPPPPPPVEAHASQHEDGGSDELTVDGLTGKLAEAQEPIDHAARHGAEGEDQLDLTDLTGLLATPQTPTAHAVSHGIGGSDPVTGIVPGDHAASHELGGGDLLNVGGLAGELADAQTPKSHGNEAHSSTFEDQANKDAASGYAGLDIDSKIASAALPYGVLLANVNLQPHAVNVVNINPSDEVVLWEDNTAPGFDIAAGILAAFNVMWEVSDPNIGHLEYWAAVKVGANWYTSNPQTVQTASTNPIATIRRLCCALTWLRLNATDALQLRIYARNDGDVVAHIESGYAIGLWIP